MSKPLLNFIRRNGKTIEDQLACLADCDFHQVFKESHSNFFGELPYVHGFMHWTTAFIEESNRHPKYNDYVSQLYTCFPPCTKALCYLEFVKDKNQSYSARMVTRTVQIITNNFTSIPFFYPVLVCGSSGKNSLLAAILKHARPDLKNPNGCFEGEKEAADGVYVWPEPVHKGGVTLMLLKLRKSISEEVAYTELRRKVTMGMTIMSSVSCLCEERSQVLPNLNAFIQDYTAISEKMHLNISKLLVLIDKTWTAVKSDLAALTSNPLVATVDRTHQESDDQWTVPLLSLLTNNANHQPFTNCHRHLCIEN